jgi:hypothetical protein
MGAGKPAGCWKNYHAAGTKVSHHISKNDRTGKGHTVRNCVPNKRHK